MPLYNASETKTPSGSTPTAASVAAAVGTGVGTVTLGSRFRPEKAWHPLPAASPAPLTTDGGIADGQPSPTTGLKFIPWTNNTEAFNYQGMYMNAAGSAVTTAASVAAGSLGQNSDTPRKYNYGTFNGEFINGTIDLRFATDSTRVIPVWYNFAGYSGTAYTDCHIMVEHEGVMKHLSSNNTTIDGMPRTQSSSGAGIKRRELTFLERRMKRMRLMLPGMCYFAGVWIDTLATIKRPNNLDLFMHNGDSWNEPNGASFSDNPGGGFPAGSYQCLGMAQWLSFETGQCHGTYAQGGTGEVNDGAGAAGAGTYTGTASSAMWSDSRCQDIITKFGPQFPLQLDIGSKNDGNLLGVPYKANYKARQIARYTKMIGLSTTAGRDMRFINVGVQPAGWYPLDGSADDLNEQGQAEVQAAVGPAHLGYISIKNMWDNTTTSGQRSLLTLNQGGLYLHLNVSGYISVCGHIAAGLSRIEIPIAYLVKQRTALF